MSERGAQQYFRATPPLPPPRGLVERYFQRFIGSTLNQLGQQTGYARTASSDYW
jgi:hypothetical protein